MCEGMKIGCYKTCLASGQSQDDIDDMMDLMAGLMGIMTYSACRSDPDDICPTGTTPKMDKICGSDGLMCTNVNNAMIDECSSDSDCDANGMSTMAQKLPCCDLMISMLKKGCDGISADIEKQIVDEAKTGGACSDSNCFTVGASSSLRATFLPAVAAVFALVATAWH